MEAHDSMKLGNNKHFFLLRLSTYDLFVVAGNTSILYE